VLWEQDQANNTSTHSQEILQLLNEGVIANDWFSMFFLGLFHMTPNNGICKTNQELALAHMKMAARWGGYYGALYCCVRLSQDEEEIKQLRQKFWDSVHYGQSGMRRKNDLHLRLELVPSDVSAAYRVYEASTASSLLQQGKTSELVASSFLPSLRITNERNQPLSGLKIRICVPKQRFDKTFPITQTIGAHETLELDLSDFGVASDDSSLNIRISAPDGRYSEIEMDSTPSLDSFINDDVPPLLLYWEKGFFGGFVLKIRCLSNDEWIHNINVIKASNQAHGTQPFNITGSSAPASVGWAEMSDSAGLQEGEIFFVTCDEYSPIIAQILTTPNDQSSSGWKNVAKMGAAAAAIAASVLGSKNYCERGSRRK